MSSLKIGAILFLSIKLNNYHSISVFFQKRIDLPIFYVILCDHIYDILTRNMEIEVIVEGIFPKFVLVKNAETGAEDLCSPDRLIERDGRFYVKKTDKDFPEEKQERNWKPPFWAIAE